MYSNSILTLFFFIYCLKSSNGVEEVVQQDTFSFNDERQLVGWNNPDPVKCSHEEMNIFDPPVGYSRNNCSFYKSHEAQEWLPKAYLNNAYCACSIMPDVPSASCVRKYVQSAHQFHTSKFPMELIKQAKEIKSNNTGIDYFKFTQDKLVPYIYELHVEAYEKCGCPSKPAAYPAWKIVSSIPIECTIEKYSILIAGPCHGIPGCW